MTDSVPRCMRGRPLGRRGQKQSRFSARARRQWQLRRLRSESGPAHSFLSVRFGASPGAPSARRREGIGRFPDVCGNLAFAPRRPVVARRGTWAEMPARIVRLRHCIVLNRLAGHRPMVRPSSPLSRDSHMGVPPTHVDDRAIGCGRAALARRHLDQRRYSAAVMCWRIMTKVCGNVTIISTAATDDLE
jgi:hypothetical protein